MDGGGDRDSETSPHPNNVAIIREVYDSEHANNVFAMKLEQALDAEYSVIIIEPTPLGESTAYWIFCGNYLHRTAVVSGLVSIIAGLWTERPLYYGPLVTLSLLCTGLYTISWQFDPCVKYQVERDSNRQLIVSKKESSTPVVLVRKSDTRRKILHCTISLLSVALCVFRIYQSAK